MYHLLKQYFRVLSFCLPFVCSLSIQFHIPVRSLQSSIENPEQVSRRSEAHLFLKKGIRHYETEQFFKAIVAWQKAESYYESIQDKGNQALSLSNLSLAYQYLGKWQDAKEAISSSLRILNDLVIQEPPQAVLEIYAKALNTQGHFYFAQGKTNKALELWKRSTQEYLRAGHKSGVILSKINQAKALQELGLNYRATNLLKRLYIDIKNQRNAMLQGIGLRQLGRALRSVGALSESTEILQESITISDQTGILRLTQMELGHSEQALGNRAKTIGQTIIARQHQQKALQYYELASQSTILPEHQFLSYANQFSLLVELGNLSQATELWHKMQSLISSLPTSRKLIYAQLKVAQSLICLRSKRDVDELDCSELKSQSFQLQSLMSQEIIAWPELQGMISSAINQARRLQDPLAESYALGQLGRLYELLGQWESAEKMTQKALFVIEGKAVQDLRYRWEWQLGRVKRKKDNFTAALDAYARAIQSLELVRNDLVRIDADVQFSFRDNVEPIYREFVDLLLTSDSGKPSQQNLELAIKNIDALQLAELENFLGCDLSEQVSITAFDVDASAIKVYPILLTGRLAIIYEIPGQPLGYRQVRVSRPEVESELRALRYHLTQPGNTPEVLVSAQQVYEWLIAPLEPILEDQQQLKTLVFVLDGSFRNIPIGVLYDGQEYMLEKPYGLAVAPRLDLFRPGRSQRRLDLFTGGVGLAQVIEGVEFSAISQHQEELDRIAATTKTDKPLVNEAFTQTNIIRRFQTTGFSAVHWKTHGVFSSDPSQTYLVAYQERLQARDLNGLLQTATQGGIEPLDLLVLSACETAQGDDRAVLGLAGIAVRAGARSTLATLWRADDQANTELMARFYQGLAQDMTKAQALRQAQLALMREFKYPAPYYWASYVLVGSWR